MVAAASPATMIVIRRAHSTQFLNPLRAALTRACTPSARVYWEERCHRADACVPCETSRR